MMLEAGCAAARVSPCQPHVSAMPAPCQRRALEASRLGTGGRDAMYTRCNAACSEAALPRAWRAQPQRQRLAGGTGCATRSGVSPRRMRSRSSDCARGTGWKRRKRSGASLARWARLLRPSSHEPSPTALSPTPPTRWAPTRARRVRVVISSAWGEAMVHEQAGRAYAGAMARAKLSARTAARGGDAAARLAHGALERGVRGRARAPRAAAQVVAQAARPALRPGVPTHHAPIARGRALPASSPCELSPISPHEVSPPSVPRPAASRCATTTTCRTSARSSRGSTAATPRSSSRAASPSPPSSTTASTSPLPRTTSSARHRHAASSSAWHTASGTPTWHGSATTRSTWHMAWRTAE